MSDKLVQLNEVIYTKHDCLMCGQKTTWEMRDSQAKRIRIFGYSIKELFDVIDFARKHGYQKK